MQCIKPIYIGKKVQSPVGCGQCMGCRINKRREWTGRILLEASGYRKISSFFTLTYSDEHVPLELDSEGIPQQCLRPSDLQKFWKRIRKGLGPNVRYFACGEYGTKTHRPHYHGILFGVEPTLCERICERNWQKGYIAVSPLNPQRAAYTASYTVKKWTKPDIPELRGRPPEFSVCSRRPGIGVAGLKRIVDGYHTREGAIIVAEGRVTRTVRLNGKIYPLGRTIVRHMLEEVGLPSNYVFWTNTPELHGQEAIRKAKRQAEKAEARDRDRAAQRPL